MGKKNTNCQRSQSEITAHLQCLCQKGGVNKGAVVQTIVDSLILWIYIRFFELPWQLMEEVQVHWTRRSFPNELASLFTLADCLHLKKVSWKSFFSESNSKTFMLCSIICCHMFIFYIPSMWREVCRALHSSNIQDYGLYSYNIFHILIF